MSLTLELPAEYGYTLTVAAASLLLNTYHAFTSSFARKAAKIPYPNPYATAEQAEKDPKAFAFNCAQRAHANYVENITAFLGAVLITSLTFPRAGATLGGIWVLGRLLYAIGYTTKGPKGRTTGFALAALSQVALSGMAVFSATKFLPASPV